MLPSGVLFCCTAKVGAFVCTCHACLPERYDVPDLVWRSKRKLDEANHFADMDQKGKGEFAGKTLLQLWEENPESRTPASWTAFYDSIGVEEDKHRGALPFRVAQIYEEMVKFVRAKKMAEFVCAAGVLAHYVGDACQPLHVSFLHHGRPNHPEEKDVHSIYETKMLDQRSAEVVEGVNTTLVGKHATAMTQTGPEAANTIVDLMKKTIEVLPPMEVIDAFNAEEGGQRIAHMWDVLGERTITCLSAGSLRLAEIWESAWKEGGGQHVPGNTLREVDQEALMALYNDRDFVKSKWLRDM